MQQNNYIIEVNNVSKQFEDGKFALDNVSLSVEKGEFVPSWVPPVVAKQHYCVVSQVFR